MNTTFGRALAAAIGVPAALAVAPVNPAVATAAPCPDVEIIFARGTTEPPGVGGVGQAFVDAVRARAGDRSVGVYAVNYPASNDFDTSTPAGARDAGARLEHMAATCPGTALVLGGFSQGAGVVDLATNTVSPSVAGHVVAVADFGGPRTVLADSLSPGALPVISPLYAGKFIDVCVPNDPICFHGGWDMRAHNAYIQTGGVGRAADFVASRL